MAYVQVKPLDYTNSENLTTKTLHGLEILVNNITIGRVTKFTPPKLGRDLKPVRELSPAGQKNGSFGRIIEQVPGQASDESNKLTLSRTEVWFNEMEIAFGFSARFIDLCDQDRPFVLKENLFRGNKRYETWVYTGCWFSDYGIEDYTTEEAAVKLSAEISFCSRNRI